MRLAAAMADGDGPRSQTSLAYELIRADILAGLYPPGRKLKIVDLAVALGTSPGAVREALSRLVPEQLVEARDQRGFVVAPLSIADLEDLTDLRCEVEALALGRSVARGDADWEAGILAAAHRLRAKPYPVASDDRGSIAAWVAAHADFHAALVGACGSRRLLALHWSLYEQSGRYRGLSIHHREQRDIGGEHQRIVDLALAHDADGLIATTVAHIRATTRQIIESFEPQASSSLSQ